MIETINTNRAPKAIGPYSQAKRFGQLLFVSGQIPVNPKTGKVEGKNIADQTRLVMDNLLAVLTAGESSVEDVLKTTCYLASMQDFAAFNVVYQEYFSNTKPARACIAVKELPKAVLCEVDAIAIAGK